MTVALPIDEVWWFMEPKLTAIKARCRESWEPKDVYDACLAGTAFLYGGGWDRTFAVVIPRINSETGKPELFVWVAWVDKMKCEEYLEILFEIADGIGAETLAMGSPRKGYARTGWTADGTIYTREVPKR